MKVCTSMALKPEFILAALTYRFVQMIPFLYIKVCTHMALKPEFILAVLTYRLVNSNEFP